MKRWDGKVVDKQGSIIIVKRIAADTVKEGLSQMLSLVPDGYGHVIITLDPVEEVNSSSYGEVPCD